MTLHAAMYMALMGAKGLRDVNSLSASAAHELARRLEATGKMKLSHPHKPFLNEFKVTIADGYDTAGILDALREAGILGGVAIDEREMIIACTETRTEAEIELYVSTVNNL